MEHTEGSFRGHKDLNLYYQSWLPAGRPEAILLVVHGGAEHSGRYGNLVNYFVPRGYAVCGLDLRGHGKSEGLRSYVERFSDYLTDLKAFFDIVRAEHGDAKIFLVGHSLGGGIATAYAVLHQHELAGLLLSGAVLKVPSGRSPALIALAPMLSLVLPKMRIGGSIVDASAISRDKAVVDAYVNDPLVYRGKIRARFGAEILKTLQELPRQMPEINLPILIMHGTADLLCDPQGSQMLYERVGSRDKTLKLYEGFYHEILNEPGHKQVLADMEAWLATRI
ncbi:MAG: alpha/beta hydrolase [Dehalococcoidia bacterium]|nr:MAG: alpha/beta hydrolase [Dehalococcoidia bacterium]